MAILSYHRSPKGINEILGTLFMNEVTPLNTLFI